MEEVDTTVYTKMYVKHDQHYYETQHSQPPEECHVEHNRDAKMGEEYDYSHVDLYEQCRFIKVTRLPQGKTTFRNGEQLSLWSWEANRLRYCDLKSIKFRQLLHSMLPPKKSFPKFRSLLRSIFVRNIFLTEQTQYSLVKMRKTFGVDGLKIPI